VITEFGDYQCIYCAILGPRLDSLQTHNPETIAIVYVHYPIEQLHKLAFRAALMAECAVKEERFWAMHRLLFALQDSLAHLSITEFASRAGIRDLNAFRLCVESESPKPRVRADKAIARRLRISATPTLMVNDRLFRAGTPFDEVFDSIGVVVQRFARGREAP
jgi:protein-disulfide isomerase